MVEGQPRDIPALLYLNGRSFVRKLSGAIFCPEPTLQEI